MNQIYRKKLYIIIEYDQDKEFFDTIIKPLIQKRYKIVKSWKYSRKDKDSVNKRIASIKEDGDDYIFVTDMEKIQCIPGKKQERMTEFNSIDEKSRIMIVIRKIESWYTAGLSDVKYKEFGLIPPTDTSKSGKGLFKKLLIKRRLESKLISEIDFMREILKDFDIVTAKQRNTSFRYFIEKYCLMI